MAIAVGVLWTGWIAISLARLAAGFTGLRDLRRSLTEVASDRQSQLAIWSKVRTSGRRARLASGPGLGSACLIGLRDPIIALPSWMFERLDERAIDQIVVHEWAHLSRRDDLAALLLAIVRMFGGWHPVVMWIDRAIRFEREAACDDWVVTFTKNRRRYAACLVTVAAMNTRPSTRMVPAFTAPGRTALAHRIDRLMASERPTVGIAPRAMTMAALGLVTAAMSLIQVKAVGFPEPRMDRAARPPTPSVYWAASFRAPTAPVQWPSRTTSFDASRRESGWREVTATTPGDRPVKAVAREGMTNRLPLLAPGAPAQVLLAGRSAAFDRPTLAPVVAGWTEPARRDAEDSSGTLWAPALHVSEGAVRMSQGLSRGSRKAAVSTGRFFVRIGRPIAAASPRTEGPRSMNTARQP
jgi:hypothetical protein